MQILKFIDDAVLTRYNFKSDPHFLFLDNSEARVYCLFSIQQTRTKICFLRLFTLEA